MNKFKFLKVFNSPFKRPKLKWYFGKVAIGTPYFYPRRWVKHTPKTASKIAFEKVNKMNVDISKRRDAYNKWYNSTLNSRYAVPKKIGFDFVGLGWKIKWTDTDYRFEWNPIWSFVFFKWQIAVSFVPDDCHHYWACWLTYENNTDKNLPAEERIKIAKEINPEVWTSSREGKEETICYWDKVLKEK